jgi:hypothetical protein
MLSNLDDDAKIKRVQASMTHLQQVKVEREVYTEAIEHAPASLKIHPTKLLATYELCSFDGMTHISFDFAQQVHIPHFPHQPGPIFFLTPYKLGIFGINNEAARSQFNYIIPETVQTGKGANAVVISLVHHYLSNYSLDETDLYIHADNCVGQNKCHAALLLEDCKWPQQRDHSDQLATQNLLRMAVLDYLSQNSGVQKFARHKNL